MLCTCLDFSFSMFFFGLYGIIIYFTRLCWPIWFIFGSLRAIKAHTHTHTHIYINIYNNIYFYILFYYISIPYVTNATSICIQNRCNLFLPYQQSEGERERERSMGAVEGCRVPWRTLTPSKSWGQRPKWIMSICQAFRFLRLMRISGLSTQDARHKS